MNNKQHKTQTMGECVQMLLTVTYERHNNGKECIEEMLSASLMSLADMYGRKYELSPVSALNAVFRMAEGF